MPTDEDRVETVPGPLRDLLPSWLLHLRSRNVAPETTRGYVTSVMQFSAFMDAAGSTDCCRHCQDWRKSRRVRAKKADDVRKADVEAFVSHVLVTRSASTANNRYRAVQQFVRWAVAEGEMTVDPMAGTAQPIVPDINVPVVSKAQLRGLLASVDGRAFSEVRDNAMIRMFLDVGLRLSELAGIGEPDISFGERTVRVTRKGRSESHVKFGRQTAVAMDRYRRARIRHLRPGVDVGVTAWWLPERRPERRPQRAMTSDGVYQMLRRRASAIGLDVHPHQLRHSWAHYFLASGGSETDLMHNAGWKSRQMVARYARSTAQERARDAADRHSLGDNLHED